MLRRLACSALAALSLLGPVLASPEKALAPVQVLETRRHGAGSFERDIRRARQRDMVAAGLRRRARPKEDVFKTNGSLDLRWSDAELFSYGMLSVTCTECYVKGTAHATLTFERDFNISTALTKFIGEFGGEVVNITKQFWEEFEDWAVFVYQNATETIWNDVVDAVSLKWDDFETINWDAYAFPTWNVSLDMNMTEIPDATVELKFDGLELYMLLDVVLSADQTWTIPLYPKTWAQPAGFAIGGQNVGVIIGLDLILELSSEIDMSTGVHISFDDGLAMKIAMFGNNVSTITLTEGSFEFLPVSVNTSGVVFDATLRLSVKTGLDLSAELGDDVKVGAGASAQVYADLARFRTNVSLPEGSLSLRARDDAGYPDDCRLPVIETYEFGVGANAGAYVEFNNDTWGPSPNTSIQIFYTTLLSACAASATPTTTKTGGSTASSSAAGARRTPPPPQLDARQDGTSLTLASTAVTYTVTNIICQSTGLRDCPASLQSTVQETKTSTYYTSLPSGSEITSVPETTTAGSVAGAQGFGAGMNRVTASSGEPKSYVPPASSSGATGEGPVQSAIDGAKEGFDGLSDQDKRLVVGLSAGVGGALLIGLVAGITICIKRRRASNSRAQDAQGLLVAEDKGHGGPYSPRPFPLTPTARPKWDSGSDLSVTQFHVEERSLYDDPTNLPVRPRAAF